MPHPFHFAFHVIGFGRIPRILFRCAGRHRRAFHRNLGGFRFLRPSTQPASGQPFANEPTGKVGDHMVPMPHFGIVLPLEEWTALAGRLEERQTDFIIAPSVRFKGEPGEQWTMFFRDPSGNPIEVKGYASMDGVFAT